MKLFLTIDELVELTNEQLIETTIGLKSTMLRLVTFDRSLSTNGDDTGRKS